MRLTSLSLVIHALLGLAVAIHASTVDADAIVAAGKGDAVSISQLKAPLSQVESGTRGTDANPGPSVLLDNATFTGMYSGRVEKFLGIPFALPPTGPRRFRLPVTIPPYTAPYTATSVGYACPQQTVKFSGPLLTTAVINYVLNLYGSRVADDEDCLTVNVIRPTGVTNAANLPVLVWIFGGGFENGSTGDQDGRSIVERSVAMGTPIIYVAMNYRVSAFGFLASQSVKDAGVGNLGLHDQREALRWIQKYISSFGGNPAKVTIWGESAGAISASLHMLAYDGNHQGLFRGAFMQSGSPIPTGDITNGQGYYDFLVERTGCTAATDTLDCLRTVPYAKLKEAMNETPSILDYQSLVLAWLPRADGIFLTDNPQRLVQQGKVARIPFITGNCDDEGSIFALASLNVTTNSQFETYMSTRLLRGASASDYVSAFQIYPQNILRGSPFDTGIFNALTPQFKRIAAILGDAVFQAPRRFFLQETSGQQDSWAFLSKRLKAVPFIGSAHASDLLNVYHNGDMTDYLINFVVKLDPNGKTGIAWPKYDADSPTPKLLTFKDGFIPLSITDDTYRSAQMELLTSLTLENPI